MAYQVSYTSLPVSIPHKSTGYTVSPSYYTTQQHTYSASPPEAADSVTHSTGTPSYGHSAYSATSSSYAGSHSGNDDYGSSASANGVDMQEYMQQRFDGADSFDPLPLDRTLVQQAQTSGMLNAKHRELLELQQLARQRLEKTRMRLNEGYQDAKDVKKDLEWTQKRVSTLKTKASRKHPKEYKQARARYPSPEY